MLLWGIYGYVDIYVDVDVDVDIDIDATLGALRVCRCIYVYTYK